MQTDGNHPQIAFLLSLLILSHHTFRKYFELLLLLHQLEYFQHKDKNGLTDLHEDQKVLSLDSPKPISLLTKQKVNKQRSKRKKHCYLIALPHTSFPFNSFIALVAAVAVLKSIKPYDKLLFVSRFLIIRISRTVPKGLNTSRISCSEQKQDKSPRNKQKVSGFLVVSDKGSLDTSSKDWLLESLICL
jgi:hypothetical protein